MGIKSFINSFEQEVVVSRLSDVGDGKRTFTTTATAVNAAIQELDRDARMQLDLTQDRAWTAYFDIGTDIQEGDKIVDDSGVTYKVDEVTKKNYGINQHLQVILVEHEN